MAQLLTVVEVPEPLKVRCRAEGCGRAVWRRIHVVEVDGEVTVLGSECYERLYGNGAGGPDEPLFGGAATGRELSPEERELLESNTEAFVELMREQYEAELEAAMQRAEREVEAEAALIAATRAQHQQILATQQAWMEARDARDHAHEAREQLKLAIKAFDKDRRTFIEIAVRREFQRVHGLDVSLPGWAGWFEMEVRRWITAEIEAGEPIDWKGLPLYDQTGKVRYSKEEAPASAAPRRLGNGPDWAAMSGGHKGVPRSTSDAGSPPGQNDGPDGNPDLQGELWG